MFEEVMKFIIENWKIIFPSSAITLLIKAGFDFFYMKNKFKFQIASKVADNRIDAYKKLMGIKTDLLKSIAVSNAIVPVIGVKRIPFIMMDDEFFGNWQITELLELHNCRIWLSHDTNEKLDYLHTYLAHYRHISERLDPTKKENFLIFISQDITSIAES